MRLTVLLLLIFLSACVKHVATFHDIQGIVRDSTNTKPVTGCDILALEISSQKYFRTLTDSEGKYCFDNLVAGKYILGFYVHGDGPAHAINVEIVHGRATQQDYVLGSGMALPSYFPKPIPDEEVTGNIDSIKRLE